MNTIHALTPRRSRWRAGTWHFCISLGVGLLAAALIFQWWFPDGLAELAGGSQLFWLLTSVDVTLGPALTFVVANPTKPRREFVRDVGVIGFVQMAALVYGLSVIALARPAAIVWEVDQFRLVSQATLEPEALQEAPAGLGTLSWTGPVYRTALKPRDAAEQLRSIELGLAGVQLADEPRYWASEEAGRAGIAQAARPLTPALRNDPLLAPLIASIARQAKVDPDALRSVPIQGRHGYWLALVTPGATRPAGFLPIDPDAPVAPVKQPARP